MNRQTKRAMKKQEEQRKPPTPKAAAAPHKERTKPRQFVKEVVAELRKVNWATRQEVIGYTIVVLVASIVIAALIFGMDYGFTKVILAIFGVDS